ncbi:DoxX family protein [Tellurirhabdus rosea]|uniref:DoxX family protein n=1 Tax=Tellurirhabdus rosea TaxID=2674997 RepID=UPI0022543320|nr:DoxX family protein [Tellurirhabdus rosea]
MKPSIVRILTILFTVLSVGTTLLSAAFKLMRAPNVVEGLTKAGVGDFIPFLAAMEIGFALLYLYPKTMKLGFILLSCYFAGALSTELSHGAPLNAITPLVLLWISAFLREKNIFLPNQRTTLN